MDLETLLAFPATSPQEELMHVSFTPANIEYFRRKALEATFKAGRVEPNYDYPQLQAIEIAIAQSEANTYLGLIELAEATQGTAQRIARQQDGAGEYSDDAENNSDHGWL